MSNSAHAYHTGKEIKHNGMHFIFLSKGKTNIIKSIRYTYVQEYLGKALYNLGFGDYDITEKYQVGLAYTAVLLTKKSNFI